MTKVAYICEPQIGGTFIFFTQLRPLLARHGIDFRCIPPFDRSVYRGSHYEQVDGVDLLTLANDTATALGQIISHLEKSDFRAVLTLPGCHILGTTLPAYLPEHIGCAAKIPHNGRGTYRPAQEFEPYMDALAPVNYLLADDLSDRYGIPRSKIRVIHIGIDADHFAFKNRPRHDGPLRMIFVGRLNDLEKNICLLPDLVKAAKQRGVPTHCTVVGGGDDRAALEQRIIRQGVSRSFTLTGAVPYQNIPGLLHQADVFLMPSRFEGCPHALMEAMATGCVPVVSHLRGTLERIVDQGKSGFLCAPGDASSFALAVAQLANDPGRRLRMGEEARRTVLAKFTVAGMATAYAELFQRIATHPSLAPAPLPLTSYRPPHSATPTWRQFIPMPVKKMVRTIYARLGKSL